MNSDQKMLSMLKKHIQLSKSNSSRECIIGSILYTYTFEEARRYQNVFEKCGFHRNPVGWGLIQQHLNEFKL